MRLVAATALAFLLAGCGSSSRTEVGPPPTPKQLVRDALAAATASPGAQYVLVMDAKLTGTLPTRLEGYVKGDPHVRVSGTIGRDLFTAHISSSIPQIAILTGDEVVAGPGFAYLRFQDTWYGSPKNGLAGFWKGLPSLALGRPAASRELLDLLDGAIAGTVAVGPSRDGVDTWTLSGRLDPKALQVLVHPLLGGLPGVGLAKVASTSNVALDVGRTDRLPRRLRIELHADRADFGAALAAQVPALDAADAVIELDLTSWGEQTPVMRPAQAKPYAQYLSRLGLGG
jgi:hypothetical protein